MHRNKNKGGLRFKPTALFQILYRKLGKMQLSQRDFITEL